MLARDHVHDLRPYRATPRTDGVVVHLRCAAGNGTAAAPMPSCQLEAEYAFREGEPVAVRFRYGGLWFEPLDLLRMLPIGVSECPDCLGGKTLLPCERCGGVGVVEQETLAKLQVPNLRQNPV